MKFQTISTKLLIAILLFATVSCTESNNPVKPTIKQTESVKKGKITATYSIYGTVNFAGSSSSNVTNLVNNPIVKVYKKINGVYTFHGSTQASACGYYVYNTGGSGTYKIEVNGYYGLRNLSCSSISGYDNVSGNETNIIINFIWQNVHENLRTS